MKQLPDTIYIVDPYDENGNLVANTEDVCWCEDPAGNENVAYVSRAAVAAALAELQSEMTSMVVNLPADYWVKRVDATVAALGLDAEVFDAAIASRPDALEKLAGEALERGNEMTDEQRLQIRAELARAMGYSVIKDGSYFYLLDRHGSREENADGYAIGSTCEAEAWMNAPNPFTNAADNRALVAWLAADDARWGKFDDALLDAILDANQEQVNLISKQNEWLNTAQQWTRLKITAPLDTITLAAAKALGIPEAGG